MNATQSQFVQQGQALSRDELFLFLVNKIDTLQQLLDAKTVETAGRIKAMDVKEIKKPDEFDNDPKEFTGWYERFTNLLRARDPRWTKFLKIMENQGDRRILDNDSFAGSIRQNDPDVADMVDDFSENLYSYLLNYTKGALYSKVIKMKAKGVLEVYRDVVYKGRHLSKSRVCALNAAVLEPKRAANEKEVDKCLTDWKWDQQQLLDLKQPGLPEDMQKTILMKILPEPFLKHMREQYSRHDTYSAFEQEYFNEAADRANAVHSKNGEKSIGAVERPEPDDEYEEAQFYSTEWDCWLCGLTPKRQRTDDRSPDPDVDMAPAAQPTPPPRAPKGKPKGKGKSGKAGGGPAAGCWGCGGAHYQSDCPYGPDAAPAAAAWKSWYPGQPAYTPPSMATWKAWMPKGKSKGGKGGKGGKGKAKGKGKGLGSMDWSAHGGKGDSSAGWPAYGPPLGAMEMPWGGDIGALTTVLEDPSACQPCEDEDEDDLLISKQRRPCQDSACGCGKPSCIPEKPLDSILAIHKKPPVKTKNSFAALTTSEDYADDETPRTSYEVPMAELVSGKISQGEARRAGGQPRRRKTRRTAPVKKKVITTEYTYENDQTLDGPAAQWELLKYARVSDYEPQEAKAERLRIERIIEENEARVEREAKLGPRVNHTSALDCVVSDTESDSEDQDAAWLNELLEENSADEMPMTTTINDELHESSTLKEKSGGPWEFPLKRCPPKLLRAGKEEPVEIGGNICAINTPAEFKAEAERVRAICIAERLEAESSSTKTDTQHSLAPPVLLADKPMAELDRMGPCWAFGCSHGMPQLNELGKTRCGWQLMSVAIDSGAAETVIPHKLVSQHPIMETKASRSGLCYASATNQPIPNLGEQRLPLVTGEGTLRGMTFQAAPVSKALGSVKRMCASNHRVVFDEDGSYVENKVTGEINWLREENGNYMLDVWIVPPDEMPPNSEASFARHP